MQMKSTQKLQKSSKKTKQHNHTNTKSLQAQKLKIALVGFFIVKGIKSHYNHKTKATSLFLLFTACNLLPQRQALRFGVSKAMAGSSFRFAKRYALASATNKPTADGEGA